MKLYLSSSGFGRHPEELVKLVDENKKTAIIANAVDYVSDNHRRKIVDNELNALKNLGFKPEELDLRNYFEKSEALAKNLSEFGLFWVIGGNTFLLRRAFAQSSMDNWLIGEKNNQNLVYAGYSAGCCLLSPSLHGTEFFDDPNTISTGYKKGIIWEGLGLIDFVFVPHFRPDQNSRSRQNREITYYIKNGIKYKTFQDGEVLVIC